MTKFNPDIGHKFNGRFNYVVLGDPEAGMPDGPGGAHVGNVVLDPSKEFTIDMQWQISGVNTTLWLGHGTASSNWRVSVFAQPLGPGDTHVLYVGDVPNAYTSSLAILTHTATIPADTFGGEGSDEHSVGTRPGVYRLVVTVFLNNNDSAGLDVVGFNDDLIIMVENPQ